MSIKYDPTDNLQSGPRLECKSCKHKVYTLFKGVIKNKDVYKCYECWNKSDLKKLNINNKNKTNDNNNNNKEDYNITTDLEKQSSKSINDGIKQMTKNLNNNVKKQLEGLKVNAWTTTINGNKLKLTDNINNNNNNNKCVDDVDDLHKGDHLFSFNHNNNSNNDYNNNDNNKSVFYYIYSNAEQSNKITDQQSEILERFSLWLSIKLFTHNHNPYVKSILLTESNDFKRGWRFAMLLINKWLEETQEGYNQLDSLNALLQEWHNVKQDLNKQNTQ